jgi:dipeptidyl aminopeptidase/acylaminoacyl peptidase
MRSKRCRPSLFPLLTADTAGGMSRPRSRFAACTAALTLLLAACGDNASGPPSDDGIRVDVTASPASYGTCDAPIAVSAKVTLSGKAVPNFLLNFNVLAGGGAIFGGSGLTGKDGFARDIWTLSRAPNVDNTLAVRAVDPITGVGTTYFTQTVTTRSRIAFQSGRDGNAEIYSMTPDGLNLLRLTNNPAEDRSASWSFDGTKIAFVSDRTGVPQIFVMNANGSSQANVSNSGAYDAEPHWSPDGTKITFTSLRLNGAGDLFLMDANGGNQVPLTTDPANDGQGVFSPDGSKIAWTSDRDGDFEIYVMNSDGSSVKQLTFNSDLDQEPTWSPDGSRIAFTTSRAGGRHVYAMNADGSGQRQLGGGDWAAWSPDGSQIAFQGSADIWVMNANGTGAVNRTSTSAGEDYPTWSTCVPL